MNRVSYQKKQGSFFRSEHVWTIDFDGCFWETPMEWIQFELGFLQLPGSCRPVSKDMATMATAPKKKRKKSKLDQWHCATKHLFILENPTCDDVMGPIVWAWPKAIWILTKATILLESWVFEVMFPIFQLKKRKNNNFGGSNPSPNHPFGSGDRDPTAGSWMDSMSKTNQKRSWPW